jgi:hypothetical protein
MPIPELRGDNMAQVHRFRNWVAVHVGRGETVYFHPVDAERLGQAIINCAADIRKCMFMESDFHTVHINEGKK